MSLAEHAYEKKATEFSIHSNMGKKSSKIDELPFNLGYNKSCITLWFTFICSEKTLK